MLRDHDLPRGQYLRIVGNNEVALRLVELKRKRLGRLYKLTFVRGCVGLLGAAASGYAARTSPIFYAVLVLNMALAWFTGRRLNIIRRDLDALGPARMRTLT